MKEILEKFKPVKPDGTKWLIVDCPVVGTSFYPDAIKYIKEPRELLLIREPENEYDCNAIAVYDSKNRKLGHVPRDIAEAMAKLPDDASLFASVRSVWCSAEGNTSIGMAVFVKTDYSVQNIVDEIKDIQENDEDGNAKEPETETVVNAKPSTITTCGCLFLSVVVLGGIVIYMMEKLK